MKLKDEMLARMSPAQILAFYAAATQARITFSLIGGFLGLMFALLVLSIVPLPVNDKLLPILDRIITAMLPIVGTAVGFWMARQRHQQNGDGNETKISAHSANVSVTPRADGTTSTTSITAQGPAQKGD